MRTSEEKVNELHRRMKNVKLQRMRRKIFISSSSVLAVCLCIVVVSAIAISRSPVLTNLTVKESMTASIFASKGMVEFIVIALIAFTLGVAFTCFCIRLKKWYDDEKRND